MLLILICVAIVLSYFFWKCIKVFPIQKLNTLPGPNGLPFIGFSYIMSRDEPLDIILKMSEVYPSPFQISWGNKFIVMYEPDDIKVILHSKNCIDKSIFYKLFEPAFGMGLLTAPGRIWAKIRTNTAPTFSSHMLRDFFNIFVEESTTFTHELKKNDFSGKEIILQEYIANCAWKIACSSMMGIKLEPNKNKECVKAMERLKHTILYRIRNLLLFFDVLFFLTPFGRRTKKLVNLIHSVADKMILQRIQELNNPSRENQKILLSKNKYNQTHKTFFDILMKASSKENFSQKEIHDNVMTMLLTASDTITVATNFIIFMLANFPEVQEKVYQELLEIYDKRTIESAPIKYEDLQYMCYLEGVIKETMRIFPPVPLIARKVTEDIKIGEVTLPKGANIIINILKMHRNEKHWPNPLMFDPDRFLQTEINYQSYMPFSNGPRKCIGMKYGMMCMKVILATLVRTFVFKVNKSIEINEIKLKFDMLLSTEKSLKVIIEERYLQ